MARVNFAPYSGMHLGGNRSLTVALADKQSPLRRYLDGRYRNLRPLQEQFRKQAGQLKVDGGDSDPATIGSAYDYLARFTLNPDYPASLALRGFAPNTAEYAAIAGVIRYAQENFNPLAPNVIELARACWALACATAVYRGGLQPDNPLEELLRSGRFTTEALLALASDDALVQLDTLQRVARDRFYPAMHPERSLVIGPEFDASRLCPADADFICDGSLTEIKTRLGTLNRKTGRRSDSLSNIDLFQVISYALFDHSDRHHITDIAIYSSRYGNYIRWPLQPALSTMAGAQVDVAAEREAVWRVLGGR